MGGEQKNRNKMRRGAPQKINVNCLIDTKICLLNKGMSSEMDLAESMLI